jgi:MFS family permease
MHSPRIKSGVFVLEGINSLATTFYFYYVYFFTAEVFGFTKLQNLLLAASVGFLYMLCSVFAGRFAQRHGYFLALRCGFAIIAGALLVGSQVQRLAAHLVVLAVATVGVTFTWPSLEALVSEGESPSRLPKVVGLYNFVWAITGALAYFASDKLVNWGGWKAMFLVPAALQLIQLALASALPHASRQPPHAAPDRPAAAVHLHRAPSPSVSPVSPQTFLKMAWLANPFAYLAINTVIAVSPNLDQALQLSEHGQRSWLSLWMFARAAAFLLFWLWTGWHYRFRWLVNAYATMLLSLVALLLAPSLSVLLAAELVFGLTVGLIYYSSLFYSMDAGDTKGEHGGVHEAMIGAGSCAGPALGAAALHFFPAWPQSSTWGVGALLLVGLAGLLHLRWRRPAGAP